MVIQQSFSIVESFYKSKLFRQNIYKCISTSLQVEMFLNWIEPDCAKLSFKKFAISWTFRDFSSFRNWDQLVPDFSNSSKCNLTFRSNPRKSAFQGVKVRIIFSINFRTEIRIERGLFNDWIIGIYQWESPKKMLRLFFKQ